MLVPEPRNDKSMIQLGDTVLSPDTVSANSLLLSINLSPLNFTAIAAMFRVYDEFGRCSIAVLFIKTDASFQSRNEYDGGNAEPAIRTRRPAGTPIWLDHWLVLW